MGLHFLGRTPLRGVKNANSKRGFGKRVCIWGESPRKEAQKMQTQMLKREKGFAFCLWEPSLSWPKWQMRLSERVVGDGRDGVVAGMGGSLGKGKPKSVRERHLPLPQTPTPSAFLADRKKGEEERAFALQPGSGSDPAGRSASWCLRVWNGSGEERPEQEDAAGAEVARNKYDSRSGRSATGATFLYTTFGWGMTGSFG